PHTPPATPYPLSLHDALPISSLVAVDATTGEDVWHFQTVRNDVWDYDLGSQPSLIDFPTADGLVPALVLASKQGDIYILDRATGDRKSTRLNSSHVKISYAVF